jgi:probable phosphoglycerate mutase
MTEILLCPHENVVIVTHRFALTYIITAWLELPGSWLATQFRIEAGSITTLVEDDFFHSRQAATPPDTNHLNQ